MFLLKRYINQNYFFTIFLTLYIFLIFLSFFYNFFEYDEAWIFQINLNFKNNITSTYSLPLAFGGSFYMKLLSFININENPVFYFSNRSVSTFAALGNILLIYKIIFRKYNSYNNNVFLIVIFLYAYWFCFHEGGISARPEALVSFLLLFTIYAFINYEKNKYLFIISTLLNILFIFWHPLVFLVVLINYIFINSFIPKKKIIYLNIFFLSIFLFFLQIGNFFHELIDNYNIFLKRFISKEITSFNDLPLIVLENVKRDVILIHGRAKHLLNYSKISFVYFAILYLISFYALTIPKKNKNLKVCLFVFISLNIFYLIMPNKWRHHLGVVVPVLVLIFYYVTEYIIVSKKIFLENRYLILLNIFLIFLFIFKIHYQIYNHYFFKNYLSYYINTDKLTYFRKLNNEEVKIKTLKKKLGSKTFSANPLFRYVFTDSKYITNKIYFDTDFFIVSNKKYCNSNNQNKTFLNYAFYDDFVIYNRKYVVCIDKKLL